MPRVCVFSDGMSLSSFLRLIWPLTQLEMNKEIELDLLSEVIRDQDIFYRTSVVTFHSDFGKKNRAFIKHLASLKSVCEFRLVCMLDQIINDTMILDLCDEVVVNTPSLQEWVYLKTNQTHVSVIHDSLPHYWTGRFYSEEKLIQGYRKNQERLRVLCVCEDEQVQISKEILNSKDEFEWIFLKHIPNELEGLFEYHPIKSLADLPEQIESLNCQAMCIPLNDVYENQMKSDLFHQLASVIGLVSIVQDITPFKGARYRFNNGLQMLDLIRKTLASEKSFLHALRDGRKESDNRWLELIQNIDQYKQVILCDRFDLSRKTQRVGVF